MLRLLALIAVLLGPLLAVELRVASYNVGAHYTDGGYPNFALGDPGTLDHISVAAVLGRIDADVVALQEIHGADVSGDPDDLDALAASLGYPYLHLASNSGSFDTSLRVVILSRFPFLEAEDIRSPQGAKEITRHFPVVTVDVPGTLNDPVIISAHLKAGVRTADRFRRAIEMRRLAGYVEGGSLGRDDNWVIVGDFNPSGVERSFTELPSGMPSTFVLGEDMDFPVSYSTDMLSYFSELVPVQMEPRQLNGSVGTFQYGQTLDLLMVSPGISERVVGMEIYNSALDVSNEGGLMKAGLPLEEGTSLDASDHYAVVADFELDRPEEVGPYVFLAAGETVMEGFDGFSGSGDPERWSSNAETWQGMDDGSASEVGARAYGTGSDGSIGNLSEGESLVMEAEFVNESGQELTLLDISFVAEQWRSSHRGSADELLVSLLTDDEVLDLPELAFVARTDLPDGALAGGVSELRSTRLGGLSIPSGESFRLKFSFVPGADWGAPSAEVFVNEFHYDNAGSDTGEFVEVVVGPGFSGDLSSVELLLYNGSGGGVYGSHSLEDFVEGETTGTGFRVFSKAISGIQNGAADGMALVVAGEVTSFLSYEGVVTATDGAAVGMVSTDVGVSQTSNEPVGMNAIGLTGSGGGAGEMNWSKLSGLAASPGMVNAGQSLVVTGLPPQGIAMDDLMVSFVTDADQDGIGDDVDPDDDNDGMSDETEMAFGSDPLDSGSRFEVVLESGDFGMYMNFPGAAGRVYTVEWCNDLESWEVLSSHTGAGDIIRVALPADEPRAFFRVVAGG